MKRIGDYCKAAGKESADKLENSKEKIEKKCYKYISLTFQITTSFFMVDVCKADCKDRAYMFVVERVVDLFTVSSAFNYSCFTHF